MVRRTHKGKLVYVFVLLVLVAIVLTILEATNTTHIFHESAVVSGPTKPITQLPKQESTNKNPTTDSSGVNQGTTTDKNGLTPSGGISTSPSKWAMSDSGLITLKVPVRNTSLVSGVTISGSAASGPVQYRLIDNQVGVISQGSISVVNGNFTASVNFKAYSTTGRLDIFNTDSNSKEINEVQIPVNF